MGKPKGSRATLEESRSWAETYQKRQVLASPRASGNSFKIESRDIDLIYMSNNNETKKILVAIA